MANSINKASQLHLNIVNYQFHFPNADFAETVLSDTETTVADLRNMVQEFVNERDWEKFHAPKNVSMALAIEAAELMEHFQWLDVEASREIGEDAGKVEEVGEELADVLCYGLALANTLGLDVSETMRRKMEKNRAKYPVDRYRGTFDGS